MSSYKSTAETVDFDEEGRRVLGLLNIDPSQRTISQYNQLDSIFVHPTGNGTVYVGNATAAENIGILKSNNITHIVNCTHGGSALPCYHKSSGEIKYYTFPISEWWKYINATNNSVYVFTDPLFEWIENCISKGESVLVHCLAGAHRAGTTGCAILMRYADLDVRTAIATAKKLRPIIDPIGQLPQFLQRLEIAQAARKIEKAAI